MANEKVRITHAAHRTLQDLADSSGEPMMVVLERALDAYRRQRFLDDCNRAFAALRVDPRMWEEELAERAVWEATLADGL